VGSQQALQVLESAAKDLCAKASACFSGSGDPEGKARCSEAWLHAACELATSLKASTRPPPIPGGGFSEEALTLSSTAVLLIARLLLQCAMVAAASNTSTQPQDGEAVAIPEARTAVYVALKRSSTAEAEIEEFLQRENVPAAAFEQLLKSPRELKVRAKSDRNSTEDFKALGTLECGPEGVAELKVMCSWKDQGWGHKKGRLRVVLRRGESIVYIEDMFGICMEVGPRDEYIPVMRTFSPLRDAIVALAVPGDVFGFEYKVGTNSTSRISLRRLSFSGPRRRLPCPPLGWPHCWAYPRMIPTRYDMWIRMKTTFASG